MVEIFFDNYFNSEILDDMFLIQVFNYIYYETSSKEDLRNISDISYFYTRLIKYNLEYENNKVLFSYEKEIFEYYIKILKSIHENKFDFSISENANLGNKYIKKSVLMILLKKILEYIVFPSIYDYEIKSILVFDFKENDNFLEMNFELSGVNLDILDNNKTYLNNFKKNSEGFNLLLERYYGKKYSFYVNETSYYTIKVVLKIPFEL